MTLAAVSTVCGIYRYTSSFAGYALRHPEYLVEELAFAQLLLITCCVVLNKTQQVTAHGVKCGNESFDADNACQICSTHCTLDLVQ